MQPAIPSPDAPRSLLLDIARAGERLVVVGEQGHIILSDDGGAAWTHAEVPVSLMLTAVAFPAPESGWAVGHEAITLSSGDGGKTWGVVLTGEAIAALQVDAAREVIAEAEAALEAAPDEEREDAQYALDDALFALEDAERAIEEGIPYPALDVWFESPERGYILGAYGLLLATRDGGTNWALHSKRLDNPDGYHFYGIARSASGALVIAGEAGGLHRSRDDGMSWERLDPPYAGSFFGILATADGSLLIFGLRGNIFRSEDDGDTWMPIDAPGDSTLFGGRVLRDGRIVLVGAAGTVLESRDGGLSFGTLGLAGRSARNAVAENTAGDLVLAGFGGVRVIGKGDNR
jgi:photosystem II stability/assembly factor-like uncharacterized protein